MWLPGDAERWRAEFIDHGVRRRVRRVRTVCLSESRLAPYGLRLAFLKEGAETQVGGRVGRVRGPDPPSRSPSRSRSPRSDSGRGSHPAVAEAADPPAGTLARFGAKHKSVAGQRLRCRLGRDGHRGVRARHPRRAAARVLCSRAASRGGLRETLRRTIAQVGAALTCAVAPRVRASVARACAPALSSSSLSAPSSSLRRGGHMRASSGPCLRMGPWWRRRLVSSGSCSTTTSA